MPTANLLFLRYPCSTEVGMGAGPLGRTQTASRCCARARLGCSFYLLAASVHKQQCWKTQLKPGLGHSPSSLTLCRDWSSSGLQKASCSYLRTLAQTRQTWIDGSRPRELLSRHILHVSCGPGASQYIHFN